MNNISTWVKPVLKKDFTKPTGKITLIRDVLGVEVYRDEAGVEWVAQPNGDLILNK